MASGEPKRWINQYVDLSQSMPDLLVSCAGRSPEQGEINRVKAAASVKSRLFLELGSGSGGHLIQRASAEPESFFFGIEIRYKRAYKTAEKAKRAGLSNLLVIRTDIANIEAFFDSSSIDGIFINFPDPWDRKKWKKHRMLSESTLPVFHRVLKSGGFIRYKTDHRGYFEDSLSIASASNLFTVTRSTENLHASEHARDNVLTEFERLFLSQKLPIFFSEFSKQD